MPQLFNADDVDGVLFVAIKPNPGHDSNYVGQLSDELVAMLQNQPHPCVVLDLSRIQRLGPDFARALFLIGASARNAGAKLGICSANEAITEILLLLRWDRLFGIFNSRIEASETWGSY